MDATDLAELFHETYELLAPDYGYETRQETRVFDPNSPNGKLMIAVSDVILCDLVAECQQRRDRLAEVVKLSRTKQQQALKVMKDNDLKIDDLDDQMQKLAFTFYNYLVELSMRAEVALAELDE